MKKGVEYKYVCTMCGYTFKDHIDKMTGRIVLFEKLVVCPECYAKKKFFKKINVATGEEVLPEEEKEKSKLELKKLKELKEKQKEIEQEKIAKDVLDSIYDETVDLLDDLIRYIINGEMSINRFQEIFLNASYRILDYRKREYYPDNRFIRRFEREIIDCRRNVRDTYDLALREQEELAYEQNSELEKPLTSWQQKMQNQDIEDRTLKGVKKEKREIELDFKEYLKKTINK